jgi:NTP pyrophosphatase (non-canonical NTP hydrolase)
MYYIYHIPGKKIGVTRNLNKRVEFAQGYSEGEYEVLETSNDIHYVSQRERILQRLHGYKVDRDSYKEVIDSKNKLNKPKTMKLNITEQTVTFPCPLSKLKGQLMDSLGLTFKTQYGNYILTHDLVEWITKNAAESMFNISRSYVYNKALDNYVNSSNAKFVYPADKLESFAGLADSVDLRKQYKELIAEVLFANEKIAKPIINEDQNVYDSIRQWATERGIYERGDSKTQYVKLMEESGELARAILKRDKPEIKDAIGDMIVVLTNLARLEGFNVEDCVTSAYDVIKNRKGQMENGTFVKSTL